MPEHLLKPAVRRVDREVRGHVGVQALFELGLGVDPERGADEPPLFLHVRLCEVDDVERSDDKVVDEAVAAGEHHKIATRAKCQAVAEQVGEFRRVKLRLAAAVRRGRNEVLGELEEKSDARLAAVVPFELRRRAREREDSAQCAYLLVLVRQRFDEEGVPVEQLVHLGVVLCVLQLVPLKARGERVRHEVDGKVLEELPPQNLEHRPQLRFCRVDIEVVERAAHHEERVMTVGVRIENAAGA